MMDSVQMATALHLQAATRRERREKKKAKPCFLLNSSGTFQKPDTTGAQKMISQNEGFKGSGSLPASHLALSLEAS